LPVRERGEGWAGVLRKALAPAGGSARSGAAGVELIAGG